MTNDEQMERDWAELTRGWNAAKTGQPYNDDETYLWRQGWLCWHA